MRVEFPPKTTSILHFSQQLLVPFNNASPFLSLDMFPTAEQAHPWSWKILGQSKIERHSKSKQIACHQRFNFCVSWVATWGNVKPRYNSKSVLCHKTDLPSPMFRLNSTNSSSPKAATHASSSSKCSTFSATRSSYPPVSKRSHKNSGGGAPVWEAVRCESFLLRVAVIVSLSGHVLYEYLHSYGKQAGWRTYNISLT